MHRLAVAIFWAAISGSAAAQTSSGTAFAVTPEFLVTNQHIVSKCGSIEVISANGRYRAEVVDADEKVDLALLHVSGLPNNTARLRNSRDVRLGESVMVFGFPLSGALTSGGNFTSGLVSGLRGFRDSENEIQITAPVQPGNSGGPVLDASGQVVGVVQAKLNALGMALLTGDIPQNVNFAISLGALADFLTKNKVKFREGSSSAKLDTAEVAKAAKTFTYPVECGVKLQQAKEFQDLSSMTFDMEDEARAWLSAMSRRLESKIPDRLTREEFLLTAHYEARRAGVDPQLVLALIQVASNFRKFAISNSDARGYMQVNQSWSAKFGNLGDNKHNLFHLRTNLRYGCVILRLFIDENGGNLQRALVAYKKDMDSTAARNATEFPNSVLSAWKNNWKYP